MKRNSMKTAKKNISKELTKIKEKPETVAILLVCLLVRLVIFRESFLGLTDY